MQIFTIYTNCAKCAMQSAQFEYSLHCQYKVNTYSAPSPDPPRKFRGGSGLGTGKIGLMYY